jgi:hypothetical protein
MTNAQQPTRRTRHVDIKQFVILQWSEEDLMTFTDCPSALNIADSLTKQTGCIKFYEHMDIIMGRRCPEFSMEPSVRRMHTCSSASHNCYAEIVSSMAG